MSSSPYPSSDIDVLTLEEAFEVCYRRPPGVFDWPLAQVQYLLEYLKEIGCKTAIVERHYIDRVYMHDDAIYYVRNLRPYPNFTQRIHFFGKLFTEEDWRHMLSHGASGARAQVEGELQLVYCGFTVVRPIPGSPVGRTVLRPKHADASAEARSSFKTLRAHPVHFAGFSLSVTGVPFQTQDQGVSACATAALWSALDCVAAIEGMPVASPASIAEAATKYPLQEGRPFPTEGLSVRQICEATRSAGFSPLVVHGRTPEDDALQIFSYAKSGFAPVLALTPIKGGDGHAVCCVGVREGTTKPQTNPKLNFREAASALQGVYIHDDRLGPYAFAGLSPYTTDQKKVRTVVDIEWPDAKPDATSWLLHAIVVPVPQKLRLSLLRLHWLGLGLVEAIGDAFGGRETTLNCRYVLGREYLRDAFGFALTEDGLYRMLCQTPMSRLVGVVEISGPSGPILDILVDSTEALAEASVLACVKRLGFPSKHAHLVGKIAENIGTVAIS